MKDKTTKVPDAVPGDPVVGAVPVTVVAPVATPGDVSPGAPPGGVAPKIRKSRGPNKPKVKVDDVPEIAPESIQVGLDIAFNSLLADLVGPEWRISEEESRQLAKLTAAVIAKYSPDALANMPEWALAFAVIGIAVPRVIATIQRKRENKGVKVL
jgi:hypothetical protein